MSGKAKILLIEDEKDLVRLIRYNLEKEKYEVFSAGDAESALLQARKRKPELVILDIMLPKMDGLEFLRLYRRESKTPVILVTARRSEPDRILGLKLGADDYVVKPFSIGELLARVEAVLRRVERCDKRDAGRFESGALSVDLERHDVRLKASSVRLTPKEFGVLRVLIEAQGKVLSRERLLQTVWGHDENSDIDTRTVDQHVARLRRKLKSEGRRITTVTNFGYQFKT